MSNPDLIEVEQKFIVPPAQLEGLLRDLAHVGDKAFRDTYYDRPDLRLLRQDQWLRTRGGEYVLKIPAFGAGGQNAVDEYNEVKNVERICVLIGAPGARTVLDAAREIGAGPVADIRTMRNLYTLGNLSVVHDLAAGPHGFEYELWEVEIETTEDGREVARHQILEFIKKYGLITEGVMGKVQKYFELHRPDDFAKLVEAGIMP